MHCFLTTTIGCKVNQYEAEAAAEYLRRLGLRRIQAETQGGPGRANLVVVNTCCVTATAAAKSRRAIRRAAREHPEAQLVILGCAATEDPEALRRAAVEAGAVGVHIAGHDGDVAACLQRAAKACGANQASQPAGPVRDDVWMRARPENPAVGVSPSAVNVSEPITPPPAGQVKGNLGTASLPAIRTFAGHQRAFVKVQDGCDAHCSYCIVPRLRRRIWSRPIDDVLREARELLAHGHKEIVLCGVFLGAYGQDTTRRRRWRQGPLLGELIRRLCRLEGLWRLRLSSLEPGDLTDELLAVFRDCPRLAPHLHLPLQSGSGRILAKMNRQYGPGEYLRAVERLRKAMADPAITTDILVGFPGETEADFAETLRLARQVGFARVHIFPFSPRPGTAAWKYRHLAPPNEVVKERCRRLAELAGELAGAFRRRFLGRTAEVLVERPNTRTPPGHHRGLSDRYIEVAFPKAAESEDLTGRVVSVQLTGPSPTGLLGRRVQP